MNKTILEETKHNLGSIILFEEHYPEKGARFYTCKFEASKKAKKLNVPVLLMVTDTIKHNSKTALIKLLETYEQKSL